MRKCLAILALVLFAGPSHAATTKVDVWDDYVVPAGETHSDLKIFLRGPSSSVVLEEGATLEHSRVLCVDNREADGHGVLVTQPDARLIDVEIVNHCGGDSVRVENTTGFRFWQGSIKGRAGGDGIRFENVTDAEVFGVVVFVGTEGAAIGLHNSTQVQIVASSMRKAAHTLFMDETSSGNQVVRSRFQKVSEILHPDNFFSDNFCAGPDVRRGFLDCASGAGSPEKPVSPDWGSRDDFSPRWFTACDASSFQKRNCDFPTPQEALAIMQAGDRLVIDSAISGTVGALVIDKPDILVLGNEHGGMKGKWNKTNDVGSIDVTATGVHVQNFIVHDFINTLPDTEVISVRMK